MIVIFQAPSAIFCILFCKAAIHTALASHEDALYGTTEAIPTSDPVSCVSTDLLICQGTSTEDRVKSIQQRSLNTSAVLSSVQLVPTNVSTDQLTDSPANQYSDLLALLLRVSWCFTLIIYPIVGIIGIVTNIMSFIVLINSGLNKPSNIFLLVLAIADSICLIGAVNIPYILEYVPNSFPFGYFGWEYSESSSFYCFVFARTFTCLYAYGLYVSASICCIITLERVIAVYLPLHYTNIVTPTRAWLACFGAFLVWLPYLIFTGLKWHEFKAWPIATKMLYSIQFRDSDRIIPILDYYFASIFGKFVPLAIVTVGSVLISVQVSMTTKKRQKMMSASKTTASTSRTTRTLLLVCLTFSVTKILTLPTYFIDATILYQNYIGGIIGVIQVLFEYLNGSSNFFIYVLFNKKFKDVFLDLFKRKAKSNKKV